MDDIELFKFAFCGYGDALTKMIEYLASIAEEENWTYIESQKNSILMKYIKGTFKQCYKQNKLLYSTDNEWCCLNTGLLTPNGNDILMLFEKNRKASSPAWVLKSFRDKTERYYMDLFDRVPELATYTDNYELLYFNPNYPIVISTDHILDDNWDRIKEVVHLSKPIVKSLMIGVIEETKRNKEN